jgi:DNA-binding transcriptional MerR regulator
MTMRDDLLQIGEFAKLAGTNLRTLRYYEELGLLEPDNRSAGGFRYYRRDQLDRMAAIKRLRDLGLSLRDVAAAIRRDGERSAPEVMARLQAMVEKQIDLVEHRIERLQKDLAELQSSRRRLLDMCRHCGVAMSRESCDPCPKDQAPMPAVLRALI